MKIIEKIFSMIIRIVMTLTIIFFLKCTPFLLIDTLYGQEKQDSCLVEIAKKNRENFDIKKFKSRLEKGLIRNRHLFFQQMQLASEDTDKDLRETLEKLAGYSAKRINVAMTIDKDLLRWIDLLLHGELTNEDFIFLVCGKNELNRMKDTK